MRIALLQATGIVGAAQENRETLEGAARSASSRGADLLLTPELFLSGYDPLRVHLEDGANQRDWIARAAAAAGIGIVASTVDHDEAGRYICASLFDRTGQELTRYRKQHLFGADESGVFRPGTSQPELVRIGDFTAALGICFDIEFPEFAREQALRGANLLLIPTAVPLRASTGDEPHPLDTRIVSTVLVPARALESQVFVAYANHAGPKFSGTSTVADPYGRRITTAGDADAEIVFADLDHNLIRQARTDIGYLAYFNK
ncbi:nitrilase-related carbon-nitrogen hydrolase [Arthrobacter sp. NtRootA1]|uniref:nitrilase-related carbon-nitrogen hydrolase n=1 Tax=Micrococcaceae TaxID=1268 RepID=UPI001CC6D3C9|nr:nitrilase-related carbon-nitrogen hydrolase [Arthrobacter sp. NtRootA1]BCW05988.1 hydrolase [Arthrobacter sp. NtRootA1]